MVVVVCGVGWNVPGGLVVPGRGGCGMWSGLECTGRACDARAWYVGVLSVGWNVLEMLVVPGRGCGAWRWLECSWRAFDARAWYVGVLGVGCGTAPAGCSKEYTPNTFYYNT